MTQVLPKRHEAQQLCKLRALRVQRAREAIPPLQKDVERAEEAVRQRQVRIEQGRRAIDDLQQAVVTSLATALPRWSGVTEAHKEKLADQLERDEYGLIDDEHDLEKAQDKLQAARAELTRALAREDAVRGLAKQTQRAHAQAVEQRAEREVEDLGRPRR